ncbi:hypothetical protein GO988_18445 [Hymenobacter sp. HMF4947]|uniref:TPM domain-containing protein n=1 Tax=Hymenobacter ginkgonis TaxID=2682976 RepID=A0A7K1TIU3_9BACT|nr:TPM domain-containing protein [Hymenobacter ginkgonis]MVN78314.1 hypothetical protein [Hymenobacter ginkgonis]
MPRFVVALLLLLAGLSGPASAAPADGLPTRPVPFTFVTDQGNLLAPADAKKLEGGLRKYAETTGTQVVVVTVPSLNGTDVADYGRQLGTAWGVGQRDKNNGVVVLLAAKEHKVTIQAGSGLKSAVTPELTNRIINQEMTPAFKQGNYFAGLRKGLNTLMLAANPSSDPRKNATAATASNAATTTTPTASSNLASETSPTSAVDPVGVQQTEAAPTSSGFGMGSLLIGALVIGGGIWLLMKLFRRNNGANNANQAPNFMGNRPNNPTPNFGAPNAGYQQGGPGYGAAPSSGSGMGGILATGAAAAAGAYLGNRMSQGHESNNAGQNFDGNSAAGLGGAGAAAAGTGAAGDYFSSRGGDANTNAEPDYFSGDNNSADSSGDYFSSDNSSYDDTSSDDTGGGGFDSTDDNSGSW